MSDTQREIKPVPPGIRWGPIRIRTAAILFALVAGCAAPPPQAEPRAQPEAAAEVGKPSAVKPTALAATTQKHMIAAANPLAAKAGLEILRAGGSAVDAAIAAQMVLNLVEPQSSGIGGGGFMLHFAAKGGAIEAYDGRETAPATAHARMFLAKDGKPRKFYDAVVGGLAVGVPGLVAMLETAHREHGRLPWAQLFQPAIELAEKGFAISPRLHGLIARDKHLKTFAPAADYFYDAQGEARPVGSILVNRPLARTFRILARQGALGFYRGPIARDVAEAVRSARVNPGGMTEGDLKGYVAKKRAPVCLPYRQYLVCGMGPPSSGGITTLQILGILQAFNLGALKPDMKPDGQPITSPVAVHLIAEASRLAFADRNTYLADEDFVPPPPGMLDPEYLALRASRISVGATMGKTSPGVPGSGSYLRPPVGDGDKGPSTSHLSIVDGDGNAVSMTTSIENAFGSRMMVRGFLLNNQLTDFSFRPEKNGAPVANRAEPGKRPRSSMAPTLVFDGSGRLTMAVGSPGGSSIIGYVAKTLIAVLDWNMGMSQAVALPHFVNRNGPTDLEKRTAATELQPALKALGHKVRVRPMTSGLHGILVREGTLEGGADPRREGVAIGD